jgi:hypothetical protein
MQLTRPEFKVDEKVGFNRPENISNQTIKYSGFILMGFRRPVGGIWGESGVEARQESLNIKLKANFNSLSVSRQTP